MLTVCKVVFGEVLDNKGLIREIENLVTQADKPQKDVTIVGKLVPKPVADKGTN